MTFWSNVARFMLVVAIVICLTYPLSERCIRKDAFVNQYGVKDAPWLVHQHKQPHDQQTLSIQSGFGVLDDQNGYVGYDSAPSRSTSKTRAVTIHETIEQLQLLHKAELANEQMKLQRESISLGLLMYETGITIYALSLDRMFGQIYMGLPQPLFHEGASAPEICTRLTGRVRAQHWLESSGNLEECYQLLFMRYNAFCLQVTWGTLVLSLLIWIWVKCKMQNNNNHVHICHVPQPYHPQSHQQQQPQQNAMSSMQAVNAPTWATRYKTRTAPSRVVPQSKESTIDQPYTIQDIPAFNPRKKIIVHGMTLRPRSL